MNKKQKPVIVTPGENNTLYNEQGVKVTVPYGWAFCPAGDAGLTRKITSKGQFWRVQVKKGRRFISRGIWAPGEIVEQAREEVKQMRSSEGYRKKLEAGRKSREKKQIQYEKEFLEAVQTFLAFAPCYKELEKKLAQAVTIHAVPVGSGTVARTAMIPLDQRAAKAVIAWMRHKTTAYDSLKIPRVKGKRREVRRMLAEVSSRLLQAYRKGEKTAPGCPLKTALT